MFGMNVSSFFASCFFVPPLDLVNSVLDIIASSVYALVYPFDELWSNPTIYSSFRNDLPRSWDVFVSKPASEEGMDVHDMISNTWQISCVEVCLYHLKSRWLATPISLGLSWPLTKIATFWEWRSPSTFTMVYQIQLFQLKLWKNHWLFRVYKGL